MARERKRTKKNKATRRDSSEYRRLALTRATEALLGATVSGVEFPGGKSRESLLMKLDGGRSVIATRRNDIQRARVEVRTLRALNKHNASAPKLLANNHSLIIIQEEIKGVRLSSALKDASENVYASLVASALDSLVGIQHAATTEKLETLVQTLGGEKRWIAGLVERPEIIGGGVGVKAPELHTDELIEFLRVREPRFIKWDSRPGNAMLNNSDNVVWFDWEHAGKRNRLDDMAWLLGDEFLPDYPEAERTLIDDFVPRFADVMAEQEAHDYLMIYGTFHIVVRLGLILRYMEDKWWDLDYCIDGDKVGVTLLCGQRLCARGARWSSACALTQPLSPWFDDVSHYLETL